MRIVHVITGLTGGGAEMMLLRLTERLQSRLEQQVICLGSATPLAERLQAAGVPTTALGMSWSWPNPLAVGRLTRLLKRMQPDVVQTWLYHADLVGGLSARMAGVTAVAWNIRNNDLPSGRAKVRTRSIVRLLARLSHRVPDRIVCCSRAALETHIRLGYDGDRFDLIPNGFDVERFRPDPEARAQLRAELGLAPDTPLVGLVARFDPQKNHAGFFTAAGALHRSRPDVNFILVGSAVTTGNEMLVQHSREAGVDAVTHLLGERDDIPRITAALDIASSSSSWGEAFPNVLAEAMACGVPCVATDIGDAAYIVADTGIIVPRDDAPALARAWLELLGLPPAERAALGQRARRRVSDHFEIDAIANRYASLYEKMARRTQRTRA
jgi:glycosyltransferase involved in cell wall biosynthesis